MEFFLRFHLFTLCLLTAASLASGKSDNCQFVFEDGEYVADLEWDTEVDLSRKVPELKDSSPMGKLIYTFGVENLVTAHIAEEGSSTAKYDKYFNASFLQENKTLRLSTSNKFNSIDNDLEQETVRFSLAVTCAKGSAIISIKLKISDTNNNSPTFDQGEYDFKDVPMPLPTNFNLLPELYQITITDLDPTSRDTIDILLDLKGREYFTGSATRIGKTKQYVVTLTTIKRVDLRQNLTFVISARDRGTADDPITRSSAVVVTLEPKILDPVCEPKFFQPLYTANIKEMKGDIKFKEGDMKLQDLWMGDVEVDLTDPFKQIDYHRYINCSWKQYFSEVRCSWNKEMNDSPLTNKSSAVAIITAKQGKQEASTAIYLSFSEEEIQI